MSRLPVLLKTHKKLWIPLGVILFLVFVISNIPAIWGAYLLTRGTGVALSGVTGTLWNGRASLASVRTPMVIVDRALDGVDLTLREAELALVAGRTGSGKSTIISLLMGFYPLDQGCIRFDDHPMSALSLSAVRRSIGLVQQDPFIFVGTLAENLRLGRDGRLTISRSG